MLSANRGKYRSCGVEGILVATAEQGKHALVRGRSAAGNRNIQNAHSESRTQPVQSTRSLGTDGTHLDYQRTRANMFQHPLWSGVYALYCLITRKARHNNIRTERQLSN